MVYPNVFKHMKKFKIVIIKTNVNYQATKDIYIQLGVAINVSLKQLKFQFVLKLWKVVKMLHLVAFAAENFNF